VTVTRIADRVEDRLSDLVGARESAAAPRPLSRRAAQGGDGGFALDGALSLWASGAVTFIENDGSGRAFDGEAYTPALGLDYATRDGWVFGVTAGAEQSDLTTDFNQGTIESLGFTTGVYAGRVVASAFVIAAGAGYVGLDYDRTRSNGAISGSFDGDRVYAFANVTGYMPSEWLGSQDLSLRGRVGFRYSHEDQSAFRENGTDIGGSTLELGQVSFGGEARYFASVEGLDALELFLRAGGAVDVLRTDREPIQGFPTPSGDRTEGTFGLGVVGVITDTLSVDFGYETVFSREDITEHTLSLGLRLDF